MCVVIKHDCDTCIRRIFLQHFMQKVELNQAKTIDICKEKGNRLFLDKCSLQVELLFVQKYWSGTYCIRNVGSESTTIILNSALNF